MEVLARENTIGKTIAFNQGDSLIADIVNSVFDINDLQEVTQS